MNTELFKKIHEVISVQPGKFDMEYWEDRDADGGCGTTRCVAGWAIYLTTNRSLTDDSGARSQSTYDLADRLGVRAEYDILGAKLLDLPPQAVELFYVSDDRAREFVRLAAWGQDDAALGLLGD